MNLFDTLHGLLRRWYILVPGLILAIAAAIGAWQMITPHYQRSAWILLVPGQGTIPEESSNPYLFLGGLSPAADAVVRAVSSPTVLNDLYAAHPELSVEVRRDPVSAGPVIQFVVTAPTDHETDEVLGILLQRASGSLDQLQIDQGTRPQDRITTTLLARDTTGSLHQRTRVVVAVGAAGGLLLLTLLIASAVDGLAGRRRKLAPKHEADSQ